jgi:hypothetical protein
MLTSIRNDSVGYPGASSITTMLQDPITPGTREWGAGLTRLTRGGPSNSSRTQIQHGGGCRKQGEGWAIIKHPTVVPHWECRVANTSLDPHSCWRGSAKGSEPTKKEEVRQILTHVLSYRALPTPLMWAGHSYKWETHQSGGTLLMYYKCNCLLY